MINKQEHTDPYTYKKKYYQFSFYDNTIKWSHMLRGIRWYQRKSIFKPIMCIYLLMDIILVSLLSIYSIILGMQWKSVLFVICISSICVTKSFYYPYCFKNYYYLSNYWNESTNPLWIIITMIYMLTFTNINSFSDKKYINDMSMGMIIIIWVFQIPITIYGSIVHRRNTWSLLVRSFNRKIIQKWIDDKVYFSNDKKKIVKKIPETWKKKIFGSLKQKKDSMGEDLECEEWILVDDENDADEIMLQEKQIHTNFIDS